MRPRASLLWYDGGMNPRLLLALAPLLAACPASTPCLPDGSDAVDLPEDAIINGTCAPEGELFTDHYSCDTVAGPCTDEAPGQPSAVVDEDPARLDDPDLAWSTAQLGSCSCSCCHGNAGVAAFEWSWEFAPVWTDSANTERLRDLAAAPPSSYSSIPADDNNGFERETIGVPTNDAARMRGYIEREIARRGE